MSLRGAAAGGGVHHRGAPGAVGGAAAAVRGDDVDAGRRGAARVQHAQAARQLEPRRGRALLGRRRGRAGPRVAPGPRRAASDAPRRRGWRVEVPAQAARAGATPVRARVHGGGAGQGSASAGRARRRRRTRACARPWRRCRTGRSWALGVVVLLERQRHFLIPNVRRSEPHLLLA